MKKVLLSSLLIGSSLIGFSQGIKKELNGYAFDNFDSESAYNDPDDNQLGIYLWDDTINTITPYIKSFKVLNDGVLLSDPIRNGDGIVSYTVSQPYGLFVPQLGVSFGEGKGLNITGGSSKLKVRVGIKFDLTTIPLKGLKVKFGIQSIKGSDTISIDAKGTKGGKTLQYEDEIAVTVSKAGVISVPSSLTNTISFHTSRSEPDYKFIDIDFSGGYQAMYPKPDLIAKICTGGIGTGTTKGALPPKTGFDSTFVTAFQMTFLNAENAGDKDCFLNFALTNLKFDLTYFAIGDIAAGETEEEVFNKKGFIAYPSPIKGGNVKLSATADNVKVYDVMGSVVFESNSASEINVDTFSKGLYIVKSSKGTTRFVVE